MPESKPAVNTLKTGAFARGLSLARMSLSAGARAARFGVGNLFAEAGARPARLEALVTAQTAAVVRELGLLKGSAMKVGQMLSMVGDGVLPPQATALLKTLQSQAPPLPWPRIERVLRSELGPEKLATLVVDPIAVASASLGQVHRAVRRADGVVLALKVQYPGVDLAIDSDLRVLRRLLGMARLLPVDAAFQDRFGDRFDGLFDEVRIMMRQELDYARELVLTDQHRALVGGDPRYILPRTFPELSSARVLATSFEEGVPVDGPEVAALTQERRNALGLAALEFTLQELMCWRRVQTDPHFGNYRIRLGTDGAPDRIVMLDFGAVRTFERAFLDRYLALARGAAGRDVAGVEAGAIGLGLLLPDDPPAVRGALVKLAFLITEPLGPPGGPDGPSHFTADGSYRWGESDLPRRAMRRGGELAFAAKLRTPPREMLFLDRKLGGLFFFLSTLKAVVQARPLVEEYLARAAAAGDSGGC